MLHLLSAILLFSGLLPPPFAFPQAKPVQTAPVSPVSFASRLVVTPSSRVVAQGDALVIRAQAGADETLVAYLGDLPIVFMPDKLRGAGNFVALVKIDRSFPTGQHILSVSAATTAANDFEYCDNLTTIQTPITVLAAQ